MGYLRIGDLLAENAKSLPDTAAIIEPAGKAISWKQLDHDADRLAGGLINLGLKKGDRVATVVRNGIPAMECLFALAKPGLVGIPINYGLTAGELRAILKDSAPHAIVIDSAFLESFGDAIASSGATVVVRGDRGRLDGWFDYDALKAEGGRFDSDAVDPDDVRTIRYTSGTTAAPKGCIGTHRQILSSIANFTREIDLPSAPFLQLLPLFSGAGIWMAFAAAHRGMTNVIPDTFNPVEALEAISSYKIGHACGVPTMLGRLCDAYEAGNFDVSSLKLFGYTGSPMPPSVIRRALRLLSWSFYQGFGGGEMGGLVSYLKPEDHPSTLDDDEGLKRLASVGRPARYAEVVVRSLGNSEPVAQGELGEISVRSPSNFSGYLNRPEETAATLRGDWVHSGDVGYFDAEGLLHVVDRIKDMVLTGGMNVSSAEVEGVLMDHPAVKIAAVFGLPDDDWGEVVTAAVILRPAAVLSEAELIAFARKHLASYKVPKAVKFVDAFPMNSAGKILKRELRERFVLNAARPPEPSQIREGTEMQWTPDSDAGPRGYLVEPETFETLDISLPAKGVALITLNRPEKLNAFDSVMIGEIRAAMWRMNYDDRVRVIVITGRGRGFCTGRDVTELRGERSMPLPHYRAHVRANHDMLNDLEAIEKPVIAAINGICAGGGVELAASCDFRFASSEATFLLPEIFIGVIPASGACSRMIQMIGIENVKDMVMTGRTIDADEMRDMRFVRSVVPADKLMDEVLAFSKLLRKGAPLAVGIAKHVTNTCQNVDTETGRILERLAQSSLVSSTDSTEGVKAFIEKRAPNFTGR